VAPAPAALPAAPATTPALTSALPPSTLATLYVQNVIEKVEEEVKKLEKKLDEQRECLVVFEGLDLETLPVPVMLHMLTKAQEVPFRRMITLRWSGRCL
jgi:hypothetical protein